MEDESKMNVILTDLILCKILKLVAKKEKKWIQFVKWELINKRLADLLNYTLWKNIHSIKISFIQDSSMPSFWKTIRIVLANTVIFTIPYEARPLLYLKNKGIKYSCMTTFIDQYRCHIKRLEWYPVPAWLKDSAPPIINTTLCNYSGSEKITLQLLAEHESSIKHVFLVADERYLTFLWSPFFRNATDFSLTLKEIERLKYHGGLKQLARVTLLFGDTIQAMNQILKQRVISMLTVIQPQCLDFSTWVSWLTDPIIIKAIQLSGAKCLRVYSIRRGSFDIQGITFPNIESLSLHYYTSEYQNYINYSDWRFYRLPNYFPNLRNLGLQVQEVLFQSPGGPDIFHLYQNLEKINEGRFHRIKAKMCTYFVKKRAFSLLDIVTNRKSLQPYYTASEISHLISKKYPAHRVRINKSGDVHFKLDDCISVYYHTKEERSSDVRCVCFGHEIYRNISFTLFEKCPHVCFCEHF